MKKGNRKGLLIGLGALILILAAVGAAGMPMNQSPIVFLMNKFDLMPALPVKCEELLLGPAAFDGQEIQISGYVGRVEGENLYLYDVLKGKDGTEEKTGEIKAELKEAPQGLAAGDAITVEGTWLGKDEDPRLLEGVIPAEAS